MTKLMSRGWFTMSLSFGPPGALAFPRGKSGAATTYPAAAQACSSRRYRSGVDANPCPKTTSGQGLPLSALGGYQR